MAVAAAVIAELLVRLLCVSNQIVLCLLLYQHMSCSELTASTCSAAL